MSQPLVSVYCLAYNHEKYIRQALEGFVNQKTSFQYEVFVNDDASTDNTAAIIKEYADKYPDIIYPIYQKINLYSQDVDIPRDILFPQFKGKYVAVCEGDDYCCDENKLQMQIDFLENNLEYVACTHNSLRYNVKTGKKEIMFDNCKEYDIKFEDAVEGGGKCYHTSSVVYRIEYMKNRPEFFEHAGGVGDYPLAMYLTLSGKVRFFNKIMSVYRVFTENSWTVKSYSEPKKIQKVLLDNNELLFYVNKYTQGRYSDKINKLMLQNEYMGYEITHDLEKLSDNRYDGIWDEKGKWFKLKRILKKNFGWIIR